MADPLRKVNEMLTLEKIVTGYQPGTPVLNGITMHLEPGTTTGLMAPSGSGKTTLARIAAMLNSPWSGTIAIDGTPVQGVRHTLAPSLRRQVALVFQSPRRATNPRHHVGHIIDEPLRLTPRPARSSVAERSWTVTALAQRVGLDTELLERYPHEISDGQLQRACLARALATRPRYLVCDEITSMLDASTTANIVRTIIEESHHHSMGVLTMSHDRQLLEHWADHSLLLRHATLEPQPQPPSLAESGFAS